MRKLIVIMALAVFICGSLSIFLMELSQESPEGPNVVVAQLEEQPMDAESMDLQQDLVSWYAMNLSSNHKDPGFLDAYWDILDLSDHAMGYITVPAKGICLPIYHGADAVGEEGAGHLQQTAFPVGAPDTHSAMQVQFSLEEGDYFYLHIMDQSKAYQVAETGLYATGETSFAPREGNALCTLVMPVGEQVLLMRGEITESAPAEEEIVVRTEESSDGFLVVSCIVLALGILLVPLLVWWK